MQQFQAPRVRLAQRHLGCKSASFVHFYPVALPVSQQFPRDPTRLSHFLHHREREREREKRKAASVGGSLRGVCIGSQTTGAEIGRSAGTLTYPPTYPAPPLSPAIPASNIPRCAPAASSRRLEPPTRRTLQCNTGQCIQGALLQLREFLMPQTEQ